MNGLKQKFGDMQAIVTVVAVLLMMPPIILIFNGAGFINQIPVVVAFIFGAWLVLILVTWWLVRVSNNMSPEKPEEKPEQINNHTPLVGTDI